MTPHRFLGQRNFWAAGIQVNGETICTKDFECYAHPAGWAESSGAISFTPRKGQAKSPAQQHFGQLRINRYPKDTCRFSGGASQTATRTGFRQEDTTVKGVGSSTANGNILCIFTVQGTRCYHHPVLHYGDDIFILNHIAVYDKPQALFGSGRTSRCGQLYLGRTAPRETGGAVETTIPSAAWQPLLRCPPSPVKKNSRYLTHISQRVFPAVNRQFSV